jgi:uncharacterized protein (TIGR03435 family)
MARFHRLGYRRHARDPGQSDFQQYRPVEWSTAGSKDPTEVHGPKMAEYLERPVTDRMGLTGSYDFKLQWTPDPAGNPLPADPGQAPPDPAGPTFFTAVQEQSGLKLESQKGPVEILIIDRAEKASEN